MVDIKPVALTPEEVRRLLMLEADKYTPAYVWEPAEDATITEFYGKVPLRLIAEMLSKLGRSDGAVIWRSEEQVRRRAEVLELGKKRGFGTLHVYPKVAKEQPRKRRQPRKLISCKSQYRRLGSTHPN